MIMSFYDLTKEGVLRADGLFKYRLKRDSTIPTRGGQKDFEPDGSWLQAKHLETFLQERKSILSEPRVEKLRNVVEGTWDEEKKLVSLKKPGKFWMYMGFTDERRNWLHPEEALFLMETNTLELYFKGRSMSIQEAYSKLLGSGMCLEEYQVFSHLRRLGYVVLRHEEERIFTDYERQINLTEYIDTKKRKERIKRGKGKSNKKLSNIDTDTSINNPDLGENHKTDEQAKSDIINSNTSSMSDHASGVSLDSSNNDLSKEIVNGSEDQTLGSKRKSEEEMEIADASIKKLKCDNDVARSDPSCLSDKADILFYNISSWSSCFQKHTEESGSENCSNPSLRQTVFELDSAVLFPDMGQNAMSNLKLPPSQLLPSNLELPELVSDEMVDKLKNPAYFKISKAFDRYSGKEDLKEKRFSCLNTGVNETQIKAGSWSEYKRKKAESLAKKPTTTPVDYLWDDSVTPLMRPAEVTSYKDIINRLQIIQSANKKDLVPDISVLPTLPKISFDVHLPDQRFKKTLPGIPDHRVCVTRSDGIPPGLTAIQHFWNKYKDDVPLHWAVVDSGEIAFYVFDNSRDLEILSL